MPTYHITHRWSDEEALDAMREAADFFTKVDLPEGVEFLASYNFDGGCHVLWKAPSKEVLLGLLEGIDVPTFRKNMEITEVIQSYPPTIEYIIRLWY